MKKQNQVITKEHSASAKADNLHISTKHTVEICRHLRYKTTIVAKKILEDTINMKAPIPFKRFKKNVGHRPGMAAGRFPQKAAREILKLLKAVETNAQFKGLNTSNLKISKMLGNKASIPMTGGRRRGATKRTSLEIEVIETKEIKKGKAKNEKKENLVRRENTPGVKGKSKAEEKKQEIKKEVKKTPNVEKIIHKEPALDKQIEEPTGEQER